ncbi:uncharacterized protein LOC113147086 [Cyclospora cayetanensis]|uniref:Uncharacterized protein LOC113147086 n=1 Tax=Cyclospora cayetanensis TaxID=88456 RepID=A0A6P6RXB0_9EIME|nr:uncharacterized protein LOC113147086 [Cyclospora cayetanensis]
MAARLEGVPVTEQEASDIVTIDACRVFVEGAVTAGASIGGCPSPQTQSQPPYPVLECALLNPPVYAAAASLKLPPHLLAPEVGLAFSSAAVRRHCEALLQLRCWQQPCRDSWLFSYVFAADLTKQQEEMNLAIAAAAEAKRPPAAAAAAAAAARADVAAFATVHAISWAANAAVADFAPRS